MSVSPKMIELFQTIDAMDAVAFANFITEDGKFLFGNMPPVEGRENIINFVSGFYQSIKSLKHELSASREVDNTQIVNGIVTYTRHNGTTLTIKFCNIFGIENGLIKNYDVYMDASQLYAE